MATIVSRRGKTTAAIYENQAIMEDLKVSAAGGVQVGLNMWELSVIPFLLNNAGTWIDILDEAIRELDKLQELFLRFLPDVLRSTPKPLLY